VDGGKKMTELCALTISPGDCRAIAAADRLVVLSDGKVVHDGAGQDAEGVLDLMKAVA